MYLALNRVAVPWYRGGGGLWIIGSLPGQGLRCPQILAPLMELLCSQILVANDRACRLLGSSSLGLIGQQLKHFFLEPNCEVVRALSEEHMESDGNAAVALGTVVSCPEQGPWPPAVLALP